MSVNAWSHGLENSVGDTWFLRQFIDFLFIFIGELDNLFVAKSFDVVGLDDGVEDWEAVFDVCAVVEFVDEDTSNFNLVSWSCSINEIVEDVDLFLARNSAWWDGAGGLLDGPFLVVTEEAFALLDVVGASATADDTLAQVLFGFIVRVVQDRTLDVLAAIASEVALFELWEDGGSLGDDTPELNESIQVDLSKISELIFNWEVLYSHENLSVQFVVVWVKLGYQVSGDLIEADEHESWLFGEPNGKSWELVTQVVEDNLETLLVVLAHFVDFLLIDKCFLIVLVVSQERLELSLDVPNDFLFTEPLRQLAPNILHIQIGHIIIFIDLLIVVAALSHHAHSLLADLVVDVILIVLKLIIHKCAGSSALHGLSLQLLSIKLHVNVSSLVHIKLEEAVLIVESDILVIIKLRSMLVIIFHVVEEIVSLNFIF